MVSHSDPDMPEDVTHLPNALPTGYAAVLADTRWEAGALRGFDLAKRGQRIALLDADRAPRNPEVLQAATHIVFAAQAIRELTGGNAVEDALAEVRRTLPGWIAATDGARGTFLFDSGRIMNLPGFSVSPVDTLGAGDVYHGALTLVLAEGSDPRQAIRFASAAAALKCTRFGGRLGTPTRPEVEAFLDNYRQR